METKNNSNHEKSKKDQIVELVEAAGGVAIVSLKLNSHPLTVLRWGYRGRIPRKYIKNMAELTPLTPEQKENLFG